MVGLSLLPQEVPSFDVSYRLPSRSFDSWALNNIERIFVKKNPIEHNLDLIYWNPLNYSTENW